MTSDQCSPVRFHKSLLTITQLQYSFHALDPSESKSISWLTRRFKHCFVCVCFLGKTLRCCPAGNVCWDRWVLCDTHARHVFGPRRRYLDQVWQVKGQVQPLKHTWERIGVCMCVRVFVCNKDLSRLHRRTLANWEGRVCFGFEWAVWELFPFTCSLDFGYAKLNSWRQGKVLWPRPFWEYAAQNTCYIFCFQFL